MSRLNAVLVGAVVIAAMQSLPTLANSAVPEDSRWSDEFSPPELGGSVTDAVAYQDGLAVCGSLTIAGSAVQARAAWWDGSLWHELGTGPAEGPLTRLIVLGDSLIAIESVSQYVTRLTRWNGRDWRAFGGTLDGTVQAMAILEGQLVVGGDFANVDGRPIGRLARWDGTAWGAFPGGPNGRVRHVLAVGDMLVVAGDFTLPAPAVARWDGATWREMSDGLPPGLATLCCHNGSVMAGGCDTRSYPQLGWVSGWNGSTWQPQDLGGTMMDVLSLVSLDGRLFVSGADHALDYRWDTSSGFIYVKDVGWHLIGGSFTDVYSLRAWGNELVALGVSAHIGETVATGLAAWNGTNWRRLGGVGGGIVAGVITSIADVHGVPVVGGNFHAAGSEVCGVATWSDGGWVGHALEGALVSDILCHDGHVYLVGPTGPTYRDCGTAAWHSIDYGTPSVSEWGVSGANALAEHSGDLYAGYTACESTSVVRPASPGVEIVPLFGDRADALCSWSGSLFAGGAFKNVGDVPVAHIAEWNGVEWRQPGDGLDGAVGALVAWGSSLVAGGQFGHSGQLVVSRVAAWDGVAWRALGAGFNGPVFALAVIGNRLYAGGAFTASGDTPVSRIAYWDGAHWRPLGSGVDGGVYALRGIGTDLWVGGTFSRAGDKPSLRIARWNDALVPVHLSAFSARRESGRARIQWQVAEASELSRFQVWRELPGQPRSPVGVSLPADRVQYSVVDPEPPAEAVAYWLQESTTDGTTIWYGPAQLEAAPIPVALRFGQNHPNPFNPGTTFSFVLPKAGHVTLAIYDVRGALTATLIDADLPAGEQGGEWNGLDARSAPVPSGVYFARLATPSGARTVKVTVAR